MLLLPNWSCGQGQRSLRMASFTTRTTSISSPLLSDRIIGQREEGAPSGMMGKWGKARAEIQITEWLGHVPDFIITIDAEYAMSRSDAEFSALVEHELYHAAQWTDPFCAPKFRKSTGLPAFTLRSNDVEEVIGVVRRYSADATHVRALVDAANEQQGCVLRARVDHRLCLSNTSAPSCSLCSTPAASRLSGKLMRGTIDI